MKEKTLVKLVGLASAIYGIIAFAMLFMPGITQTSGNTTTTYNNSILAFGGEIASSYYRFNFSFLMVLAYFLPLVAAVLLLIVELFGKAKGLKFVFGIISFAAFVCSLIFVVMTKQISTITLGSGNYSITYKVMDSALLGDFKLGMGALIAIVVNALGVCFTGTYTVLQLLKSPKKKRR